MAMTQTQFDRIKNQRRQLLDTPNGRAVLTRMLHNMGLFRSANEIRDALHRDPSVVQCLILGIALLEDLGLWTEENFPRLVDAMATLPIPNVEKQENGET